MEKYTVVCVGASIVSGQVSYDFVSILSSRMARDGFRFINEGFPGDQAYNLLMRLDRIIEDQPDFAIILIGTNDVTATLSSRLARLSRLTRNFPQPPSTAFYQDNIAKIVEKLKKNTSASIALISLPILGENLNSVSNQRIREYNTILKVLADKEQVAYLPVYEHQASYITKIQKHPGRPYDSSGMLSIKALARHFLLRQSFDEISRINRFVLLTDGIHMNSLGATIIADEVEKYLCSHKNGKQ